MNYIKKIFNEKAVISIVTIYFILIIIGTLIITHIEGSVKNINLLVKSITLTLIGIATFFITSGISDYDILKLKIFNKNNSKQKFFRSFLPLLGLILLILVPFFGHESNIDGAKRILLIFGKSFQPSVFTRLCIVIIVANMLTVYKAYVSDLNLSKFFFFFWKEIVYIVTVIILLAFQPHLSSIISIFLTVLIMLILGRVNKKVILSIISISLVFIITMLLIGWRANRIKIWFKYNLIVNTFYNTNDYILKEDQTRNSLIGLSSGNVMGKGGIKGMSKHGNLPASSTDFVVSVIGEEFGFIGNMIILTIYFFLILISLESLVKVKNLFYRLTGIGFIINICVNVFIHYGVNYSILPNTGVTLPFISAGGTSIVINSFALGVVTNIIKRAKKK